MSASANEEASLDNPVARTAANLGALDLRAANALDRATMVQKVAPVSGAVASKAAALKKAWTAAGTQDAWDNSSWAKRLQAKKTRKGLSDFQRFKVMVARKQKSAIVKKEMKKLKA